MVEQIWPLTTHNNGGHDKPLLFLYSENPTKMRQVQGHVTSYDDSSIFYPCSLKGLTFPGNWTYIMNRF